MTSWRTGLSFAERFSFGSIEIQVEGLLSPVSRPVVYPKVCALSLKVTTAKAQKSKPVTGRLMFSSWGTGVYLGGQGPPFFFRQGGSLKAVSNQTLNS